MNNKIRGNRDEGLYFIKDFKVLSTNNNTEYSQKRVNIKKQINLEKSKKRIVV